MADQDLRHHGGNDGDTVATTEREQTAGEKCQTGNLTPGRLEWISMYAIAREGHSPYDWCTGGQTAADFGGGS